MGQLRISLFGRFQASYDGRLLEGLEAPKAQELLSFLMLRRDRPHAREKLGALIWPESRTSQSRKQLRHLIWQLQNALNNHDDVRGHILLVEPDWLQIDPGADIWIDAVEFERTFAQAQGYEGHELNRSLADDLRQAVPLYQGDLLEGYYQDWCLFERERFQNMYLSMLSKLMGCCEAQRQYDAGIEYGGHILAFDTARERTYRGLMRLHYMAGDRTTALRLYDRCVKALRSELDVAPSVSTVTLYEQIRNEQIHNEDFESRPSSFKSPSLARTTADSVHDALTDLESCQSALNQLQQQLGANIAAIQYHLRQSG